MKGERLDSRLASIGALDFTILIAVAGTIRARMLRVSRQPSGCHPRCSCHLRSPTQIHAALSPGTARHATTAVATTATAFCVAFRRGRAEKITNIMRAEVTRRRKKQSKRRRGEARSERVEARNFYASPRNKTKGREKEEGNRSSAHGTGEERRKRERKSETLTASRGGAG